MDLTTATMMATVEEEEEQEPEAVVWLVQVLVRPCPSPSGAV